MKIPLIILTIIAIAALIVAFIFVMEKRIAQQKVNVLSKQLAEVKAKLADEEAFSRENVAARDNLADNYDALKRKYERARRLAFTDPGTSLLGRNNAEMKQEILQRLRSAVNEDDDEIAVLNDDAFAVLTRRILRRADYESKIDKLFKLLRLPMMNNGVDIAPVVYGAVTVAPEDGDTMQLLERTRAGDH